MVDRSAVSLDKMKIESRDSITMFASMLTIL